MCCWIHNFSVGWTPWNNRNGWLGVKHQITYLLSLLAGDWDSVLLSTQSFSLGRLLDQYVTDYTTFQLAVTWPVCCQVHHFPVGSLLNQCVAEYITFLLVVYLTSVLQSTQFFCWLVTWPVCCRVHNFPVGCLLNQCVAEYTVFLLTGYLTHVLLST